MSVRLPALLACVLAAFGGCASPTDHALDLGETGAAATFPDRIDTLAGIALDRSARPATRFAAVRSLAHVGGAQTVEPLAGVMRAADTSPLRRWAVWGLGQTGVPGAVPLLAEAAAANPDEPIVEHALEALARLSPLLQGDPATRLVVLRAVNSAECRVYASSRLCALAALLRNELAGLEYFAAVLEEAVEHGEAAEAHNALCWTGDLLLERPNAEPPARERALELLLSLVDGENAALRHRALWYLGRLAEPETAPALARAARAHPDRATRLLSVWALWRADSALLRETFEPMPAELLAVTPHNWREARDRAAELGEPDLEIQRLIADLLREDGR